MPVLGGFFNSVSGDRKYDAEDMNTLFEGMVAEGVFSAIGDTFAVSATTGMQVSIGTGKAFFLNSWVKNTTDAFKTLSAAHATYDRWDVVALDFDKSTGVRANTIVVVEGTPSGTPVVPTLSDTATHLQVPLAHIYVAATVSTIYQVDITNKVGTVDCPFITGLLDQVDISTLLQQWEADYNVWKAGIEADLAAIDTGDVFDELNDIRDRPLLGRNLLINGDFLVNQLNNSPKTGYVAGSVVPNDYVGVADRWALKGNYGMGSTWTLTNAVLSDGRHSYKIECTSALASPAAADYFHFLQEIEASRLSQLQKGSAGAKPLVLRFRAATNMALAPFVVEIYDRQNDWSISKSFTCAASGVFEDLEWVIPKETAQALTLDNSKGLGVIFWLVTGSNFTGGGSLQTTWGPVTTNKRAYSQTNFAGATGRYLQFSDVQLEIGNVKSDYERLSHDESLSLCRRYREFYANVVLNGFGHYDVSPPYKYATFGFPYASRKRSSTVTISSNNSTSFALDVTTATTITLDTFAGGYGVSSEDYRNLAWEGTSPPTLDRNYALHIKDLDIICELT